MPNLQPVTPEGLNVHLPLLECILISLVFLIFQVHAMFVCICTYVYICNNS